MGKMLDPQNVTMRANRMMKDHLRLFEEHFGSYERDGSRYCFSFNENTIVKVYYENSSKLLTKTFSTMMKITIHGIKMKENWKAKLNLSGFVKVEKVSLKEFDQNSKDIVGELNGNHELRERMLTLLKDFDLQNLTFDYNKDVREMNITIRPYPGAFIWVKMPPIYYDIRFKPEEIKKLHEITTMFYNFFKNYM